jgi:predicted solute-binding protein
MKVPSTTLSKVLLHVVFGRSIAISAFAHPRDFIGAKLALVTSAMKVHSVLLGSCAVLLIALGSASASSQSYLVTLDADEAPSLESAASTAAEELFGPNASASVSFFSVESTATLGGPGLERLTRHEHIFALLHN